MSDAYKPEDKPLVDNSIEDCIRNGLEQAMPIVCECVRDRIKAFLNNKASPSVLEYSSRSNIGKAIRDLLARLGIPVFTNGKRRK